MYRSNRRAMTFIEVLFVIVMLGVLMAIALPSMSGFREGAALRGSARDLANAGMLARQMAIIQGETTSVRLDPTTGEWNVELVNQEAEARRRLSDQRGQSSDERIRRLHEGVRFAVLRTEMAELPQTEATRVTFFPSGSSSGLAIQLVNRRDGTMVVEFDRATGRPEIYEGEPKTLSQKLRERGLDPTLYGLPDDEVINDGDDDLGFRRIAGSTEDERVAAYKDVADRMMERARTQWEISQNGGDISAYYREQNRWGQ